MNAIHAPIKSKMASCRRLATCRLTRLPWTGMVVILAQLRHICDVSLQKKLRLRLRVWVLPSIFRYPHNDNFSHSNPSPAWTHSAYSAQQPRSRPTIQGMPFYLASRCARWPIPKRDSRIRQKSILDSGFT